MCSSSASLRRAYPCWAAVIFTIPLSSTPYPWLFTPPAQLPPSPQRKPKKKQQNNKGSTKLKWPRTSRGMEASTCFIAQSFAFLFWLLLLCPMGSLVFLHCMTHRSGNQFRVGGVWWWIEVIGSTVHHLPPDLGLSNESQRDLLTPIHHPYWPTHLHCTFKFSLGQLPQEPTPQFSLLRSIGSLS